jgi:hypothetical protein
MNQKLLALYGLKWNPFSPELPIEAIFVPPRIENFCWRIEQAQIREGGFAMIHGDPGTGKSVALRLLAERLGRLRISRWARSIIRRATSPISIAKWAISLPCPCARTTAGVASRPCARSGSRIWKRREDARCCWSMRRRR